jgi:MoxR-like ATPase
MHDSDPGPFGDATPRDELADSTRRALQAALYECKRVVVGQDAMLERVLVALLTGGHVLLEGVPGLAKTLTVRTLADVLGGSFSRVQFTPDLVPPISSARGSGSPTAASSARNSAPCSRTSSSRRDQPRAREGAVRAAEVMQEHQVTIGGRTHPVPEPFLVLATQNPIESEGTYALPEAQVDRFLFKLVVAIPPSTTRSRCSTCSRASRSGRKEVLRPHDLLGFRRAVRGVYVDRAVKRYAVRLVDATRHPEQHGLPDLAPLIQFGASPRASIGLMQSAQALALLRGRSHATVSDVRDLAPDVLRHRLVLSYDALADAVSPDELITRTLDAVTAVAPAPEGIAA